MKRNSSIVWGIVLVIVSVLLILNITNILTIDIFFDGWWTLFIIIPSFVGLFDSGDKSSNLIGLAIGGLLLAACQNWIDFEMVIKLIIPVILLISGLSLIFKNSFNKVAKIDKKEFIGLNGYTATFSSVKEQIQGDFKGADVNAIFGSVFLDLSEAKFKNENYISVSSVFGGVTLILPSDVRVETGVSQIFGDVNDRRKIKNSDANKVLYIKGSSVFGGIEIR